jgi:ketosteroid isomerase-like protein
VNRDHPNSLLILQCWQAASVGDGETLRAIFSETICWHSTSDTPWQGDYTGHEAVLEYLGRVGDESGSYDLTLETALADDLYGTVICTVSSERESRTLNSGLVLLARFEDRKISEVWTLSLEPRVVQEFWSNPQAQTSE